MKTTLLINRLETNHRRTIYNSKKDFIIFDAAGNYHLTDDLARHRAKYILGGTFAALECIRQDIRL